MSRFEVKLLTDKASVPTKNHPTDAGWDLYCCCVDSITIKPLQRKLIPIGCSFSIPEGYYGRIADRSGNAWKQGLHVMAGVIDSSYRGEVKVVLVNLSEKYYVVNFKDRVAQLIITKIYENDLVVVNDLDTTSRNEKGFGSSGK